MQSVLRYGIPDTCMTHGYTAFWKDDRESPDTWLSSYVFEKQNCSVTFQGSMNSRRQQTPEFIGRKGRLIFSEIGQNASLFETYADGPAYRPALYPQAKPDFEFSPGKEHHKPDFLTCVRTRGRTQCNEDEAFVAAVTLLMSFESYRQQRLVQWDAEIKEIV